MLERGVSRNAATLRGYGIGLIVLSVALCIFEYTYSLGSQSAPSLDGSWLWLHVLLWSMVFMYYPFMVLAAALGATLILAGLARRKES
jgi:hypothetical protein